MDSWATGRNIKEHATNLCVELSTTLAANAAKIIEFDIQAFNRAPGRQHHAGQPPRRVDLANAELAERWLSQSDVQARMPDGVRMETEENPARPFGSDFRSLFLRVDELDGTSNAAATAQNWSTVALAFVWDQTYAKHVLAGGAIALPDGHAVSFTDRTRHRADGTPRPLEASVYLHKWDTYADRTIGDPTPVDVRTLGEIPDPPHDGEPDVVLINASAGTVRCPRILDRYPALLRSTSYRSLCAGTPITYAAARGLTGMIVDPGESTLHDSAHLFILAALGWTIMDLETRETINLIAIAEEFALVPGYVKALPPTVAFRQEKALELLGAVQPA